MLWLVVLLFLLAMLLLWLSSRQRHAAGLPGGRLVYVDTSQWGQVKKPLYDPILNLTGKPDYLVEQGNKMIPIEVKSKRVSQAPYDAHIFQLAAYCLLVHRTFGKRPPHGILHYPNRTFAIDYTAELESSLLDLVTAMRASESRKEVDRSHQSPSRCQRCGFRSGCDQALV